MTVYSDLIKQTDGSNKRYTIHYENRDKHTPLIGAPDRNAPYAGIEVFSRFGKLGQETSRTHHIGFFHSEQAAIRSADRVQASKRQKGYIFTDPLKQHDALQCTDRPRYENLEKISEKKDNFEKLFDPIPKAPLRMTASQRNRFRDIIE